MKLSRFAAVAAACALVSAVSFGQLSDGSFEGQTVGTTFGAGWIEGGGGSCLVSTAAANGFPSNGANYATIDSSIGLAAGVTCQTFPTTAGGYIYQDFGGGSPITSISLDWTWLNNEGANQATYNDFFQISLYDVTTPATPVWLADLVYVDTHTTLPACPNAGVTLPVSFVGSEVAPVGPKNVVLGMGAVGGYVPGMPLRLVIIAGNRGDTAVASPGKVDNIVVTGVCPMNGQPNSGLASLLVNGVGGNACNAPFAETIGQPGTLNLTFGGPIGQPFALVAGPINPLGFNAGCIGFVDVGNFPFGNLTVIVDGTQPGFLNSLCQIGPNAATTLSFTVANMPPGVFASVQGLVFQTAMAPCLPAVLTAAHTISF